MEDEVREEDEWLYGEGDQSTTAAAGSSIALPVKETYVPVDEEALLRDDEDKEDGGDKDDAMQGKGEDAPGSKDGESSEEDDDEDSDDDDDDGVKVVIGDIKSTGQSPFAPGVKRSGPPPDKKGKFSVEDFDTPGTINGMPALDFNIDGVEDKPWRKPGADITDYFNYGFTEDTWKAYCDRQKRMRFESGGPQVININPVGKQQQDPRGVISVAFGGQIQPQRMDMMNRRREEPRENTIQVMTADRREYSRKNFEMGGHPVPPFDMSMPPPSSFTPQPSGPDFMPNPEFFNHPPPQQYYPEDDDQGYEEQWMDHHTSAWDMRGPPGASSSIVSLTKVSNVPPPPGDEDIGSMIKDERKD